MRVATFFCGISGCFRSTSTAMQERASQRQRRDRARARIFQTSCLLQRRRRVPQQCRRGDPGSAISRTNLNGPRHQRVEERVGQAHVRVAALLWTLVVAPPGATAGPPVDRQLVSECDRVNSSVPPTEEHLDAHTVRRLMGCASEDLYYGIGMPLRQRQWRLPQSRSCYSLHLRNRELSSRAPRAYSAHQAPQRPTTT
jgi:hypothetical protein